MHASRSLGSLSSLGGNGNEGNEPEWPRPFSETTPLKVQVGTSGSRGTTDVYNGAPLRCGGEVGEWKGDDRGTYKGNNMSSCEKLLR